MLEATDKLREKKCPGCGFRIMSAPGPNGGENACISYNHVAMRFNLQSLMERCRHNPFRKLSPTITQTQDGKWSATIGVAGFDTELEARSFWAFARKTDDWHLVSGEVFEQQVNGYGGSWPKSEYLRDAK